MYIQMPQTNAQNLQIFLLVQVIMISSHIQDIQKSILQIVLQFGKGPTKTLILQVFWMN